MTQEKLEEAKRLYQTANADQRYVLESLFPELKESDDERIRKGIIKYLSWIKDKDGSYMPNNIPFDEMIAWLEKQGGKNEEILVLKDQIESLHAAIKAIKETHRIELEKQGEQKPVEWSEEDEQYLLVCKNALNKYQMREKWDAEIISKWLEEKLKSIRPQKQWKPSDEQMKALWEAYKGGEEQAALASLYSDLKKLKGE